MHVFMRTGHPRGHKMILAPIENVTRINQRLVHPKPSKRQIDVLSHTYALTLPATTCARTTLGLWLIEIAEAGCSRTTQLKDRANRPRHSTDI